MDQFKGEPRLPKFAVPKRYDIHLKPDLSACAFAGSVSIDLDIFADTKFIVLNAADLSVNSGSVCFTSSKVFGPVNVELVEADEILGEKKNMAVTQFEPVDARKCFPCWDEPACKAKFKITLDVPSELVAFSNMLVTEETVDGPLKTVSCQETPIMSTYLVAVVVGLFDYVEDHTSDGIKVRVYCQVGKANQWKFTLHVAVKTLELYKVYFAVQYHLPKLDMIAVPDFAAGAMENYGLVTYRETALLFDDKHSAAANKQRVVTVVAHELAHQWFGNLVTMEWWTHLWLNEGFATWVCSADSLFPKWKVWTQFLEETTEGLRLDGLEGSHPIEVEINHASEIDEIFDAISYRKGASVIRMLQSYLGAECFQSQFFSSGSHGDGQWIVPITLCCGSYDVKKNFLLQTKSETLDAKESSLDEIRMLGFIGILSTNMVLEVLTLRCLLRSQDAVFGLAAVSKKDGNSLDMDEGQVGSHFKNLRFWIFNTRFVSSFVSPFASFEKAKEVEEFFASRISLQLLEP
ncbi:hypothetical protein GH714_029844 [Hevea brasiliensis]|uniref:Uncharacterized protein n=1 Tax=Hevea brasiliensis TaxID=3981 RepID=A0A6A6LVN3_HEVBR|nr:hypothetical protein GH714_029844 [Hevea brasiliensis]